MPRGERIRRSGRPGRSSPTRRRFMRPPTARSPVRSATLTRRRSLIPIGCSPSAWRRPAQRVTNMPCSRIGAVCTGGRRQRALARRRPAPTATARSTRSNPIRIQARSRTGRSSPPPAGAATAASNWRRSSTSPSFARSRRIWRACTRAGWRRAIAVPSAPIVTVSHEILDGSDPNSPTARANIAATCGKCHAEVLAALPGERARCGARARASRRPGVHRLPRRASHSRQLASRTRRCSPPTFPVKPADAVTATHG